MLRTTLRLLLLSASASAIALGTLGCTDDGPDVEPGLDVTGVTTPVGTGDADGTPSVPAPPSMAAGDDGVEVEVTLGVGGNIAMSAAPDNVAQGTVTFRVTNEGAVTHEFLVVPTDGPIDELPIGEGTVVDERLIDVLAKEELEPGESITVDVDLDGGAHILFCNMPGHYEAGMRIPLTVN